MPNTHATPDTLAEMMARDGDLLPAAILSTTWPTVPVSSMTLAAFPTIGYVRDGTTPPHLVYVQQAAAPVTLVGADGHYWLGLQRDTHSAVASWTRVAGTHYLWRPSATNPGDPSGGIVLADVTVAGGVITAISILLTAQPRGRVAFGGPAGGLAYDPLLTWDAAQSRLGIGTNVPEYALDVTNLQGGRVLGPLGLGVPPVSGYHLRTGTFPSVFQGDVGIKGVPSHTLDVFGATRLGAEVGIFTPAAGGTALSVNGNTNLFNTLTVGGRVGIQHVPTSGITLWVDYPKAVDYGLVLHQTGTDTGGQSAVLFTNVAGAAVGSISTTGAATAYNTSSDVRLKESITALAGALDAVRALRPVSFRWQADGSPGVGFLAHELMRQIPEAVTGEPEAVDAQGNVSPQQVDHSKIIPHLVSAVQELAAQVQMLTARVATLEGAA